MCPNRRSSSSAAAPRGCRRRPRWRGGGSTPSCWSRTRSWAARGRGDTTGSISTPFAGSPASRIFRSRVAIRRICRAMTSWPTCKEYARHFGLRVVTGTTVRRIRSRGPRRGGWTVETTDGDAWHGRVVVIATGQYRQPIVPPWPGRETLRGRIAHSATYANAAPYVGQRVLVVGAGNSGAEIATDLSDNGAASVAISVRTPPPIVPRDPFGLPVQRTSILLSALPAAIANRLGTAHRAARARRPHALRDAERGLRPVHDEARAAHRCRIRRRAQAGTRDGEAGVERLTTDRRRLRRWHERAVRRDHRGDRIQTGLESLIDVPGVLNDVGEPRRPPASRRRSRACTSSASRTACAAICSRRTGHSRRLARNVERYLTSRAD